MAIEEEYAVEFSQWSQDQEKYPWHIGLLCDALMNNVEDYYHNNRQENKWQIVFIGSQDECCKAADYLRSKRKGAPTHPKDSISKNKFLNSVVFAKHRRYPNKGDDHV